MEWKVIKPDVFAAIMDFFTTGLPVVNEDSVPSPDTGTCEALILLSSPGAQIWSLSAAGMDRRTQTFGLRDETQQMSQLAK